MVFRVYYGVYIFPAGIDMSFRSSIDQFRWEHSKFSNDTLQVPDIQI